MFVRLWHYLRGYVIVKVSGAKIERFLNLIVTHHIPIWDIYMEADEVYFKIEVNAFKRLKPDVRKTHSHIQIMKKCGLPFKTNRYRRRKSFIIGVFVFVALLWWLSSFVWLVEVEGNDTISSIDIIETLEKSGYKSGALKGKMNLREAETYLMREYPDIVWAGIKFEGTRLLVQVAESVPAPSVHITSKEATDLVAKRDALITYIAVKKGMPKVKAGDTVKKGDILVTGIIPLGEENPGYYTIHSDAKIIGRTVYVETSEMPLTKQIKSYSSKASKQYRFKFFDHTFKLYSQKLPEGTFDKQITLHQLSITKLFPLPFGIETEVRVPYTVEEAVLTEEEVKDTLLCKMWQSISTHLSEDAHIIKREALFRKTGDKIIGKLYIVAEEEISYMSQSIMEEHTESE